jgi:eukaryotic-like serine/threonine-protein kinase
LAAQTQRFGKYTLGGKVAQGGMAEIFRARFKVGPDITKQVIIKRILPKYAENERFIQMFASEARIAMGFAHGNIAQVFDFGEVNGAWFLAMELVDGHALNKILKAAKAQGIPWLPPHLAAMIISDMLKGLHYAHTRNDDAGEPLNIVHRDVSPQNVLVSYEGQVKLVDFGIAKAKTATDKTQAGVIKGKYLYFAPEQIQEKPLDGRCDVFAAGSVLYQLLTGHHPFKGEVVDVMRAIVRGNLAPPSERNPEIPPELETVVLKAMATRLEDRYQSAAEFERALSGWLHAAAPDAAADQLGELVRLLFATELAAEGRPTQPSEEFVELFNSWKREADEDEQATGETRAEGSRVGSRSSTRSRPIRKYETSTGVKKKQQPLPRGLFVGLGVLGLMAGAAAFTLLQPPPSFELKVTSEPPGAQVRVDGKLIDGKTPVQVKELATNLPHAVKVSMPGMKLWEMEARGENGATTLMHADLEKLPPPKPAEPEPEPEPPPPAPEPQAPKNPDVVTDIRWPHPSALIVSAAHHVKNLEKSAAARIDLDPGTTYKLTLDGRVSFGGRVADVWVDDCFYALEGPGVKEETAVGVIKDKRSVTVSGASRLYAFVSDAGSSRHSGAFRLTVQAPGQPPKLMLVDSLRHVVTPEATQDRLRVKNLRVLDRYLVTLKEGPITPRTRPLGKRARLLFVQEPGVITPLTTGAELRPHRVLEVGKPVTISSASDLWFMFVDDDPSDNVGSYEVSIEVDHSSADPSDLFGPLKKKRP